MLIIGVSRHDIRILTVGSSASKIQQFCASQRLCGMRDEGNNERDLYGLDSLNKLNRHHITDILIIMIVMSNY